MKRSYVDYIGNHWQGKIGEEKFWKGWNNVFNALQYKYLQIFSAYCTA
jgi:hypothetical protein